MSLQAVAFLAVVASLATTVLTKAVMVALMAAVLRSRADNPPLDRAMTWNQAWLTPERALWLTLLALPRVYAANPPWWALAPWIVVSLGVVVTDLWVLRALWAERIGPWWRGRRDD